MHSFYLRTNKFSDFIKKPIKKLTFVGIDMESDISWTGGTTGRIVYLYPYYAREKTSFRKETFYRNRR